MWGIHLGRQLKRKPSYSRLSRKTWHWDSVINWTVFYMNIMKLYDLAGHQSTFNQHRTKEDLDRSLPNFSLCLCVCVTSHLCRYSEIYHRLNAMKKFHFGNS